MYISILTPWLERRKGGGGRGGGKSSGHKSSGHKSSGGSTSGSKSGGSSGSGSGSARGGSTAPIRSPTGTTSIAHPYGGGSTKVVHIPAGRPFAGRAVGGGTRDDIFGTRQYGSGYPGVVTSGIDGRGFPFGFWPLTFGDTPGFATGRRFHSHEYGNPDNTSRPGGPLFDAPFQPPGGANTYRILSDNTTVQSLIASIKANCSLGTTSIQAVPYNTSDPNQPKLEQIIQYYRSSSISLSLDGYNNSAVFSLDSNAPATPLPSTLNTNFLDCLNQTIGAGAPLLDAAGLHARSSGLLVLGLTLVYYIQICFL